MGAICGAIRVGDGTGSPIESEALERMVAAIAHRGLGDPGVHIGDGVALVARRLPLLVSEPSSQLSANEDESVFAVADGAILNHRDLRTSLERGGHRFRSGADIEILPHLYEEYGDAFLQHIRGDFALCLWDERRRRAVFARDRQGIKPFYWTRAGDVVVFASELKALLASGLVRGEVDLESVDAFLSFGFVPGPRTIVQNVSKLLLGESLVIEAGKVRVEQFWRYPEATLPTPVPSVEEYAERLLRELDESVQLRVEGQLSPGVMLSGGLDSSVVAALAARHAPGQIKTFTIAFADAGESNELDAARRFARELGSDHEELELRFTQDTISLEELVWRMDEPLAELSALGISALADLAAPEVRVALSGQGADGVLGGLSDHRTAAITARLDRLPRPAKLAARSVFAPFPGRFKRGTRILAAEGPVDRFLAACDGMSEQQRNRLARGSLLAHAHSARRVVESRLGNVRGHPTATYIYLDEQLAAVDSVLHYNDRAATAGPIDIRFPFLDHHVVEFAASIPIELKVKGMEGKYLLRRIAGDLVPAEVLDRPKVGFFNAAIADWLRAQVDGAVGDYLLADSPASAEFLERDEIRRIVNEHAGSDGQGRAGLLLALLVLEVWISSVLPRLLAPDPPERERLSTARAT
jgi:asparagine synthase (glutamine-hydrolysing)